MSNSEDFSVHMAFMYGSQTAQEDLMASVYSTMLYRFILHRNWMRKACSYSILILAIPLRQEDANLRIG